MWKDVKNFEGLYQVSDLGRVKDKDGVIIIDFKKPCRDADYIRVSLKKDNVTKSFSVHRLVLIAFVPNPENKPQGNHLNAIKNDNRLLNLEWCTPSENLLHAIEFYKANPKLKPSYIRKQKWWKENGFSEVIPLDEHGHEILYFNPIFHEKYHYCDN